MVLVKILGAVDVAAGIAFFLLIFGIQPYLSFTLFCFLLLLVKGLFVLAGDVLSVVDLGAALTLVLSIFFGIPSVVLWIFAFLLLAKGFVSFL